MWVLVVPVLQVLAWPKFLLPGPEIYTADYVSRVVVIAAAAGLGVVGLSGPQRRWPWWQVAGLVPVLGAVLLIVSDLGRNLAAPWPFLRIGHFPAIESEALWLFDLTFGLALVAVAEELAFRKVFLVLWREKGWPSLTLASSVAFGLLHLPQGAYSVVGATVAGVVLMRLYLGTGTLWVPIVLHYIVDLGNAFGLVLLARS